MAPPQTKIPAYLRQLEFQQAKNEKQSCHSKRFSTINEELTKLETPLPQSVITNNAKDASVEDTYLVMDTPTSNSPSQYDLGTRWQSVREYSVLLAVFGAVLTSVLPILTIGGSFLLLVVIMKFPQLRHVPSNLLLASLAVSDLLIGILVQPLHSAACLCALITDNCSAIPSTFLYYFGSLLAYSSCLCITLITVDKYVSMAESLHYTTIVTKTRIIRAIFFSWAISVVLPVMRLIPSFPTTIIRVFQIILISLVLTVLIFSYMKIFCVSRRHKREIYTQIQAVTRGPRADQHLKKANTLFLVVGAVFINYSPLLIIQVLLNANIAKDQVKIIHPFAVTFFLFNSSVNPLIVFLRSRKLRTFLKKLVKCNT